jgi:hypothetical protein
MKKIVLFMFLALLWTKPALSQIDNFDYIDENAVKQFGKPLVTAIGAAMNSGSYHTAHIPKLFGFSIGVKGMMMFIPDDQKTFTPDLPTGYKSITGDNSTATIFGDLGTIYTGPFGYYTYPNGLNQSSVPFVMPQATLSLMGTELLVRYVPLNLKKTKINLFGIGLRHSVSQYIPFCPVDLAVQVLYNKLDVDNLFTSTHLAFNAEVSKTFAILTLYGGVQSEKSKVSFGYTTTADPTSPNPLLQTARTVSADVEGDNKIRMTAGFALGLGIFVLNADYSLGSQAVASAGLTFEF